MLSNEKQTPKKVKIVTIRSYNFSARLIHIGMWLWAKLRGLSLKRCYNHTEIAWLDEESSKWMTSGAIGKGVKTREYLKYINSFSKAELSVYEFQLTEIQFTNMQNYLIKAENTPYEFENFYWHLVKIITGKWKGSKSTRQSYCYEHMLRAVKASRKFEKYFTDKTLDVFMNPYEFSVVSEGIFGKADIIKIY